ncbi:hypothetical protein R9C00_11700 [Flammeovirgaceae bacterium SG7u.111]|nr:hypothetical protein [Flammeovirgaceae bacterium SG7u.132]WPO38116.1 hypothetical protein R9C00_11700 [Flammeovirgaceae bacterium SG7u.111]
MKLRLYKVESEDKNEIAKLLKMYSIDELNIVLVDTLNKVGYDSVAIFSKKSGFLWTAHKNIVYDFATYPRNFGDEDYPTASQRKLQISDRWYYETIGFD